MPLRHAASWVRLLPHSSDEHHLWLLTTTVHAALPPTQAGQSCTASLDAHRCMQGACCSSTSRKQQTAVMGCVLSCVPCMAWGNIWSHTHAALPTVTSRVLGTNTGAYTQSNTVCSHNTNLGHSNIPTYIHARPQWCCCVKGGWQVCRRSMWSTRQPSPP